MKPTNLPSDMTTLVNGGPRNRAAAEALWSTHYAELRRIAAAQMRHEQPGITIHATALVHEAYLRLIDRSRVSEEGATFFRRCFARECRRILVDEARRRGAEKRGGRQPQASRVSGSEEAGIDQVHILDLHEAIEELARLNKRSAEVVDLRIFGGLTVKECAAVLGVSASTIDNDWHFARAWLLQQLSSPAQE